MHDTHARRLGVCRTQGDRSGGEHGSSIERQGRRTAAYAARAGFHIAQTYVERTNPERAAAPDHK
jgi:hypothetical protein